MATQQKMKTLRVQIVDPQYEDYDCLLGLAASTRLDLGFTRTGHAALRTGRLLGVDLWIVNTKLPDMSGFDLLGMLRSTQADSTVFVVDDAYRLECEQQAMMLQAVQYLCKPVVASWLADWSGAMHLTRAGPSRVPP